MALTLGELAAGWPDVVLKGDAAVPVTAVTADSRAAGPGVLFVAVRGTAADGHRYLADAAAAGCAALAVAADAAADLPPGMPALVARDTRPLPALAARRLNGAPDRNLTVAGVTGTNGKTTVAWLLRSLLGAVHGPCGLLGTIRYEDGRTSEAAALTTPGGVVLYHWLARMVAAGCRSAALELSSHALDQERAAGLELDVAVMTNLGRDHLDYHADTAAYLAAKARIIQRLRPDRGVLVVNAADPALAPLGDRAERCVRFAAGPAEGPVDLRVLSAELSSRGTCLTLDWRGETLDLASPLVGRFNVENLAAALVAGLALGLDPDACVAALAETTQVPGRLERFDLPAGALAVVDYAHTHDALAAVLATVAELATGRVLVVFGAGGDRDRGKRPLMGEAAARGADQAWITSDNPRSEDPARICADITAGFDGVADARATAREVVLDRTTAIEAALAAAGAGDVVVIAGKGHEDYQLVGDRVLELDDRAVVQHWLGEAES